LFSLHGGHTQPRYDGHPESWFTDFYPDNLTQDVGRRHEASGLTLDEVVFSGFNYYSNDQPACTLFYHDHAMGITRLNVYAGLAGLYLIEDDQKRAAFATAGVENLTLSDRDIPLAFSDKHFANMDNITAKLVYPTGSSDGNGAELPPFSILPEMFGPTMTVNGRIYPYLNVSNDGYYLFRMLNACDSRFLRLTFEIVNPDGTTSVC
jgi:spore coat protein A, manganese oxidase